MARSALCGALAMLATQALAEDAPPFETWIHEPLMEVVMDPETELAPFTTDGCSGGMSGLWSTIADISPYFREQSGDQPPWEPCCVVHDQAYHNAGGATDAEASARARLAADAALQACVTNWAEKDTSPLIETYQLSAEQLASNYAVLGVAMYQAVRWGGAPCSGLPWRWGYGYPQCTLVKF